MVPGRVGHAGSVWMALVVAMAALGGCDDHRSVKTADGLPGVDPSTIAFGRHAIFAGEEREVRVGNFGRAPLEIYALRVEDGGRTYQAALVDPGPHLLPPGAERAVRIRFSPLVSGSFPATLVIESDSVVHPVLRVPLTGEGVDVNARISPLLLDYGRIEVDATLTRTLVVENPAELATSVGLSFVGADAGEFSAEATVALAPFERREIPVTWRPLVAGVKQVALAISRCQGCSDEVVMIAAEGLERAVIAEPNPLNFGPTPLDRVAEGTIRLINLSTEPQTVTDAALSAETNPSFTADPFTWPVTLPPGGMVEVGFRYGPGHLGAATGRVDFFPVSARHATLPVPLMGYGGAPELCVMPQDLDFGEVPVGHKPTLRVTVRHCGSGNSEAITITSASVAAGAPFGVVSPGLPVRLAPGEALTLTVFFEPTSAGPHFGTLTIDAAEPGAGPVAVGLSGSAFPVQPCELVVTPTALDFGTVLPGWGAVLAVRFVNGGADLCPIKNLHLTDDAGGAFLLPGGALEGVLMPPGGAFSVMVAFRAPVSGGDFSGALSYEIQHPTVPIGRVPLTAHVEESCLVASPNYLDFGVSRPDCPPEPLSVGFSNQCASPIVVTGATIGPGTSDGEFSLSVPLPGPTTLAPGAGVTLEATYAAQVSGLQASPLFVSSDALDIPLLVPLIGESTTRSEVLDTFTQTDGEQVDVLFVVDNTGTMVEEHPRLVSAMPAFAAAARARSGDMHVAVTTTGIEPVSDACPGGAQGGEAGRLVPADGSGPRLLTSSMPDLGARLQANVQVGACANVEQGFEAVRRALSPPLVNGADDPRTPLPNDGNLGFLRDAASLVVVFVGDEDDHSPDTVATYVQFLRSLKGRGQPQRVMTHAIAPDAGGCATAGGSGERYAEAVGLTGGTLLSACAPDYAPLLTQIAESSLGPQSHFPLSATPDPATLVVTMNGTRQTSGWHWDAASNAVVFDAQPPAGARIEVAYRRVCR